MNNSNKQNNRLNSSNNRSQIQTHQRTKTENIHDNNNNMLYKKPINVKKNNNGYSLYTPPKKYLSKKNISNTQTGNNSSIRDLFKLTENNENKNNKMIKTTLRNYEISKSFIDSEKRKNKTIIINRINNKSNYNDTEEDEINPIRKIKNIIIKAKLRSSFSVDGNNIINLKQKEENKTVNHEKEYSPIGIDYYNKFENKNIMKELMENNKKLSNNNTVVGRIDGKKRETNEILNDCMNNVKKRLDTEQNNKTNIQVCQIKKYKNRYYKNYKNTYNKNYKNTNLKINK